MSALSKIQWTDSTANFWEGCTKVSTGCTHCYAEARDQRFTGGKHWGQGAPRRKSKSAVADCLKWNKLPLICNGCHKPAAAPDGIHPADLICSDCDWQGFHRRRVFSLSLGDWLDPEVPIEWLAEMLRTIRQCDQLQFILCTKRPELFHQRLHDVWADRAISDPAKGVALAWSNGSPAGKNDDGTPLFDVPQNVIVLTTVENQAQALQRIPELLKIPARWRGLSCEPLLEPVNLRAVFGHEEERNWIDWLIIGGESGPHARPCNADWIRRLVEQGRAAQVPVFVKQLGSRPMEALCAGLHSVARPCGGREVEANPIVATAPITLHDPKGGDLTEWPADLQVREFPQS